MLKPTKTVSEALTLTGELEKVGRDNSFCPRCGEFKMDHLCHYEKAVVWKDGAEDWTYQMFCLDGTGPTLDFVHDIPTNEIIKRIFAMEQKEK